jgi:enoyl-[acyl-carrier protein] reductase III
VVQADLRCVEDVRSMFGHIRAEFGVLDVFVSCARPELSDFYRPPLEIGLEQWEAAINSQATSFLIGVQSSLPFMRPGGRIVAITYAPGGVNGSWRSWIAMGSAKSALEALCRYFAVAVASQGITVNAISPGLTEDSVLNSLPDAVHDAARHWHESGWTPMRRLGTPADIGRAVALLCSPDAAWITGQLIHVDGGASLMDTVLPLEIQSA